MRRCSHCLFVCLPVIYFLSLSWSLRFGLFSFFLLSSIYPSITFSVPAHHHGFCGLTIRILPIHDASHDLIQHLFNTTDILQLHSTSFCAFATFAFCMCFEGFWSLFFPLFYHFCECIHNVISTIFIRLDQLRLPLRRCVLTGMRSYMLFGKVSLIP